MAIKLILLDGEGAEAARSARRRRLNILIASYFVCLGGIRPGSAKS
jgi:hypothetical protein